MSQADDPYVYPGTSVLRNKLNIHDAGRLGRAEDDLAGVRYAALLADLPKAPFTFDTLKDIHRTLFQDVYQWAGQPRSMAMGKPETDSPLSRVTWFTRPDRIEAEGKAVFDRLEQANFLTGLDRPHFAAAAAALLRSDNDLHSFREGNGRSQRLLLAAIGDNAGHPMSFDVVTRERMVATSIEASRGDAGGLVRLLDDVSDPRRTTALRTALNAIRQHGSGDWNNLYVATTQAGQSYNGVLVGHAGQDFMMRAKGRAGDWVAIGDARDLPAAARSGQAVTVAATQFSTSLIPQAAAAAADPTTAKQGDTLNTLLRLTRPPSASEVPQSGQGAPAPMADRLRAFEERLIKGKADPGSAAVPPSKPSEEPGAGSTTGKPDAESTKGRPRSGPGPG